MKKKCESCKHHYVPVAATEFEESFCLSPNIARTAIKLAREICDKEWDGHFAYFEPLESSTEPDWNKLVNKVLAVAAPEARRAVA